MHRSEEEERVACAACGASVDPGTDRGFVAADGSVLCFDCALARGGAWDDDEDRWREEPSLRGLPHVED
jgi:hypothetical protein